MPKRILLVDDDLSVRQAIAVSLGLDHHQLEFAEDARVALGMYKPGAYELVIVDYQLPGMNGLELAEVIRGLCPEQRIILVTGDMEVINRSGAALLNVNSVLEKPFSVNVLQLTVATLMPAA